MTPRDFKAARHELGLSQNKLARLLGLSDGRAVRRYEAGDREISEPIARLLHLAINCPPALKLLRKWAGL